MLCNWQLKILFILFYFYIFIRNVKKLLRNFFDKEKSVLIMKTCNFI